MATKEATPTTEPSKKCKGCGVEKPLSLFNKNHLCKDGHSGKCKGCISEYSKAYHAQNRERRIAYHAKWRSDNTEYIRRTSQEYRDSHKAETAERGRRYQKSIWQDEEKTALAVEKVRLYRANNPHKYRAHQKVSRAVINGSLKKPDSCSVCGDTDSRIHGHHWSYLPEHRLDVRWVCAACHNRIHRDINSSKEGVQ